MSSSEQLTDMPLGPLDDAFKFFVANMSFDTPASAVKNFFSKFGVVNFVKLIVDSNNKRSKGYGFLYMMDAAGDANVEAFCNAHLPDNRISMLGKNHVFLKRHDDHRAQPLRNPEKRDHDTGLPKISYNHTNNSSINLNGGGGPGGRGGGRGGRNSNDYSYGGGGGGPGGRGGYQQPPSSSYGHQPPPNNYSAPPDQYGGSSYVLHQQANNAYTDQNQQQPYGGEVGGSYAGLQQTTNNNSNDPNFQPHSNTNNRGAIAGSYGSQPPNNYSAVPPQQLQYASYTTQPSVPQQAYGAQQLPAYQQQPGYSQQQPSYSQQPVGNQPPPPAGGPGGYNGPTGYNAPQNGGYPGQQGPPMMNQPAGVPPYVRQVQAPPNVYAGQAPAYQPPNILPHASLGQQPAPVYGQPAYAGGARNPPQYDASALHHQAVTNAGYSSVHLPTQQQQHMPPQPSYSSYTSQPAMPPSIPPGGGLLSSKVLIQNLPRDVVEKDVIKLLSRHNIAIRRCIMEYPKRDVSQSIAHFDLGSSQDAANLITKAQQGYVTLANRTLTVSFDQNPPSSTSGGNQHGNSRGDGGGRHAHRGRDRGGPRGGRGGGHGFDRKRRRDRPY